MSGLRLGAVSVFSLLLSGALFLTGCAAGEEESIVGEVGVPNPVTKTPIDLPTGEFFAVDEAKLPEEFGEWKQEKEEKTENLNSVSYSDDAGENITAIIDTSRQDRDSLLMMLTDRVNSEHGSCGNTDEGFVTCYFFFEGGQLTVSFSDDKVTVAEATKIGEELYAKMKP